MHYKGQCARQDYAVAREWLETAAMQGNAEAQFNLGALYAQGKGVRQDRRTAKRWFGKACDNGNQEGCERYRGLNKAGF